MEHTAELRHFQGLILKVGHNFRKEEIERASKFNTLTLVNMLISAVEHYVLPTFKGCLLVFVTDYCSFLKTVSAVPSPLII